MATLSSKDYMADDRTHRYWWTWVPALPLSHDDKWYRILERVFADHTTNCWMQKHNHWSGFYVESNKDGSTKLENHQTVGVFHTFSTFSKFDWVESLLRECRIEFEPPIIGANWQYQLQGRDTLRIRRDLHADIAMKIVDARGPDDPLAVIIEAKAKGGKLKEGKDTDGSYARLHQLTSFRRKSVVLLVDQTDKSATPGHLPVTTWQTIAKIQLDELARLDLPAKTGAHLIALMRTHLDWYGILARRADKDGASLEPIEASDIESIEPRVASLIRGAEIVVRARKRLPINVPTNFEKENGVEDFAKLAKEGSAIHKGTAVWQTLCW